MSSIDPISVGALVTALILLGNGTSDEDGKGQYSRLATPVWALAAKPTTLVSPDGTSAIHAKPPGPRGEPWDFKAWVVRNGHRYDLAFGSFVNAEVAWSPNSQSFFVTYSDGGAVGQYHVLVYHFEKDRLSSFEPVRNGTRFFKTNCFYPEEPNVGAIRWGPDSRTLLIAVEVPPHSSCANMGTFRAVEITLPKGKPVRAYNQIEAKRQFANELGEELMNADDECIENPKACVPPGLEASK
jgi:hypothetical protein